MQYFFQQIAVFQNHAVRSKLRVVNPHVIKTLLCSNLPLAILENEPKIVYFLNHPNNL